MNDFEKDPSVNGEHLSYWMDNSDSPSLKPLKENLEADVVVVGGGLAGLSTAYCLSQSGKAVVLVEDGLIGSGETGRTTAHLVTALDDRYADLERIFGEDKTKLIAESHQLAIDFVEQTIIKEKISCDFERINGYLFLHHSDKIDALQIELQAARRAGVDVREVEETPGLRKKEKALLFANQAQFHPIKYLKGLCRAIEKKGGKIFTGTHAKKINKEGITTAEGFTVKSNHVVIATNNPVNNYFSLSGKQSARRTYVIAALVGKNKLPKALWWDTGDFKADSKIPPYHYVRINSYNEEFDLLISGGEDHPTGDTSGTGVHEQDRYQLVEAWTRENFEIGEIIYRWSGQVLEPMDRIAYIGHSPFDDENIYVITGDSGNGMTYCSFAGLLINDLIHGKENKWEKLYSPSRFTLKESAPVFKQMMHEFLSYIKQMPNLKSTIELSEIKNGEGKIVDMFADKFGVYRDENGHLAIVSAQCTHLKCTVAWNGDERSWDCPCHGSRFTYDGKVINGPANTDLPTYSEAEHLVEKNALI